MSIAKEKSNLLDTPDERVGPSRVAFYMTEHRNGLHTCRETDACQCLNCQMRQNDWLVSYAILSSDCPLCRIDLMNGFPAGHDFPLKECSRLSCRKRVHPNSDYPVITVMVSWYMPNKGLQTADTLTFCNGECAKVYLNANL